MGGQLADPNHARAYWLVPLSLMLQVLLPTSFGYVYGSTLFLYWDLADLDAVSQSAEAFLK